MPALPLASDTLLIGGGVLVAVLVIGVLLAAFAGSGGSAYDEIGKGGLSPDSDAGIASAAQREEEVSQMMHARNERRVRRGEEPLDVEAELARLRGHADDPELEEELRQLAQARNERRVRRGEEPLDLETEIERMRREILG